MGLSEEIRDVATAIAFSYDEHGSDLVGVEPFSRFLLGQNAAGSALTNQGMRLSYWTCGPTDVRTYTKIFSLTGTTAAGATPTLCRHGVYEVDSAGNLALVASHASDTALWAGASTEYEKTLTASFTPVLGRRYASAVLITTGAALPTLQSAVVQSVTAARAPRLCGLVTGQTDLPATVAVGSVAASGFAPYVGLVV